MAALCVNVTMTHSLSKAQLFFLSLTVIAFGAIMFLGAPKASASHSWGGYHWARTANPFTLKLGDNVNSTWDAYLIAASADWSADPAVAYPGSGVTKVLNTTLVTGSASKNCRATNGMVQVCNGSYGNNGWLGIAQIWISGTHITAGTVKLNDTYFNTASYNKPSWRQMVLCQEVGHTFGLDHQDEINTNLNLGTCMDYTNDPARNDGAGNNMHPNFHDYEELATVYAHVDSNTTVAASTASSRQDKLETDVSDPKSWGRKVKDDAKAHGSLYVRDLGNSEKVFTFVTWVE